jgi:hypothetical protein
LDGKNTKKKAIYRNPFSDFFRSYFLLSATISASVGFFGWAAKELLGSLFPACQKIATRARGFPLPSGLKTVTRHESKFQTKDFKKKQ